MTRFFEDGTCGVICTIHIRRFLAWALVAVLATVLVACGGGGDEDEEEDEQEEDANAPTAEDLLRERTGYTWSLSEGDAGVPTPGGWRFLFAFRLDSTQLGMLDGLWSVNFDEINATLAENGGSLAGAGLDLSGIEHQIALTKVDDGASEPRFVHKLAWDGAVMRLDDEAAALLGDAVGPAGSGWYAAYAAQGEVGFATGTVASTCEGEAVTAVRVTGGARSIAALARASGAFAVPTAREASAADWGRAATLVATGDGCVSALAVPITDVAANPNPKCGVAGVGPDCATPVGAMFSDGTVVVSGAEFDLAADGVAIGAADDCVNCDFETGDTTGWTAASIGESGDCLSTDIAAYADLFPAGDEAAYGLLTTGGDGRTACLAARAIVVPDGATSMILSYDLLTQDASEWLGSPYADTAFAFVAGGTRGFAVDRTMENGSGGDFGDIPGSASTLGGIATSVDASYNAGGAVWDAHLASGGFAAWPVYPGETITLVLGVADTADPYWDSALVVDFVRFE
ncbi:MAG: hypothetical protein IT350_02710 [Deltaproteobacteria bacterium]|nr:hypothetical protein [Deltaproteobacteria bacterium]